MAIDSRFFPQDKNHSLVLEHNEEIVYEGMYRNTNV